MQARLIALALALWASTARATPTASQELAQARAAYREGKLDIALPLFNDLLYPSVKLASADDLVDAYVALGVCRVDAGDKEGARREFEKALQQDPDRQLDPTVVTNKAAIRLFDDTKVDLKSRADKAAALKQHALDAERIRKLMEDMVIVEPHPYYRNFLPFGSGQFQNGQTRLGVVFLAGGAATFGTSLSIWYYLVDKYGINNQHLHVDTNEAQTIRLLQQVEIATGAGFLVLWGVGVYDSLRNYKRESRRKAGLSDLPDLDPKPKPKKPKKTSVLERLHLAPMITQTGVGIGVAWENP